MFHVIWTKYDGDGSFGTGHEVLNTKEEVKEFVKTLSYDDARFTCIEGTHLPNETLEEGENWHYGH